MNPVHFGVCGLGRIGLVHAQCFAKEDCEIVAGCDLEPQRTEAFGRRYGCAVYNDLAAFLKNPAMEVAVIATRSLDHVAHAERALAAGKIVLLEKPIAVTADDFRRLRKLDQTYKGRLLFLIDAPVKKVWSDLKRVNGLGDADDHVKIMLVGANGVQADLEISDMAALPDAYCTVYGNRGTLVCADEKNIQLRYIDPAYAFENRTASPELPALAGSYGADENIPWVQTTVKVEPEGNMWELVEFATARHLYRALRENVPFPVTSEQAFDVVRITARVKKQNPQFNWL